MTPDRLRALAALADKLKGEALFGDGNDANDPSLLGPMSEQAFLQAISHLALATSLLTTAAYHRMRCD
jgi:hypothetical protein